METFGQFFQKKFPNYKVVLLLGATTFLIYCNSLPNNFLWDDEEQIVGNQLIRDSKNLSEILFSDPGFSGQGASTNGFYRPLMSLSYFLNFQIWGLNSVGFHFFQLLFHILNVLLVFFVFKKLFNLLKISNARSLSLVISLFFAVHPVNTEAIVYLGAIGEILFAFFILLAIWKLLGGVNLKTQDITPKNIWLASLFAFLGMAAKETAVIYFIVSLLFIWLFIKPRLKTYVVFLTSAFVSVMAYIILRFFIAGVYFSGNHPVPIAKATLGQRLLTIPSEIISYLKITFWPVTLSIYRNFVVYKISDVNFWGPLLLLAILAVLIFWWIKKKTKHKRLNLFFIAWFFAFLAPVLNIFPLNMTMAERWLYLPILGIFGLLTINTAEFYRRSSDKIQLVIRASLIIILILLSARVVIRNQNWQNGLTLYKHDLKIQNQNANLENNYGVELFRLGKIEEAKEHFRKSIDLQDDWAISQNNLGAILEKGGRLKEAEERYKKAMSLADYYLAYQNYAGVLIHQKKIDQAKDFLENNALIKFPTNSSLWFLLAAIYYQEQDNQAALNLVRLSLRYNPQNQQAQNLYQRLIKN